jgi:hypothetical protein
MKRYASFFEWHEKGPKELGVVEALINALNQNTALGLHAAQEFTPDPPDCVCLNAFGETVAIEVAEVVCETATRLTAQGHNVYRQWNPGELSEYVAKELTDKDRKQFNGGPYAEVIACLFTDEPALSLEQAMSELQPRTFGPIAQLTSAYLLFSYNSSTKAYPAIKLALAR